MNRFNGLNIQVSPRATKEIVLFPDKPRTKRRMRRLIGKYGRDRKHVPTSYRIGQTLVFHPVIYADLKRRAWNNGGRLT